ncbi:armadillo beta-catenin family repeat-containing protein [Cystoisospora suis]|uniref:Armadillo beta-catenin family repeat-containing protein n=1 Tax=Cystoisospora suis TaxID=483139 RepID=A0A2C6L5B1_9APIC|nr:armadillo beta-catenin family repeat-containing protein [Cystoisospora suis]
MSAASAFAFNTSPSGSSLPLSFSGTASSDPVIMGRESALFAPGGQNAMETENPVAESASSELLVSPLNPQKESDAHSASSSSAGGGNGGAVAEGGGGGVESSSIESALDSLVSQLSCSSLTGGRDYHQRMAEQLRSSDVSARLEATQAYRRSLAHRQELEQQQKSTSCACSSQSTILPAGQSPSTSSVGLSGGSTVGRTGSIADTGGGAGAGSHVHRSDVTSSVARHSSTGGGGSSPSLSEGGGAVMDVTIEDMLSGDLFPHVVASLGMPHPLLQLESILLIQRLCRGTFAQVQGQVVTPALLSALVDLLVAVSRGQVLTGAAEIRLALLGLFTKLFQDFKAHRDYSLLRPATGVVPAVLEAVQANPDIEGARCLHALVCSNLQQLKVDVGPILSLLVWFMKNSDNQTLLCLSASACVTLCERPEGVDVVLSSPALPTVLRLLRHEDQRVVFDALSVAAKIAFVGSTIQIDRAISLGVVQAMVEVLQNPAVSNPTTRARACNTLGNLGCETPKQVQPIIETRAFPLLVEIFQMDPDYNTRIEAAYAVCACLSRADPQQVGYIISCTARPPAFSGFARNGRAAPRVGGAGTRDSTPSSSPFLPSSSSLSPFSLSAASRSSPFVGTVGSALPTLGFGVFAAPRPVIEKPPPAILSFGGNNPCLRLIADMLELVCESDPMNSGSLKLCKAILRGLDNILDVGAQEAKLLGLTENPYARLFHEVQGDLKLSQMQFFPDYNIAAKTHSILEKYFDVATTWNARK